MLNNLVIDLVYAFLDPAREVRLDEPRHGYIYYIYIAAAGRAAAAQPRSRSSSSGCGGRSRSAAPAASWCSGADPGGDLRRRAGALSVVRGAPGGPAQAARRCATCWAPTSWGRDLLSRLIYGARLSLFVGLTATALNVAVAVLIGVTSGFFGGKLDLFVQRFVDAWMAFPGLADIAHRSCRSPARGCCSHPGAGHIGRHRRLARITRSAVIAVKESAFFPGRGRDRLLEVDRAGAPRAAQHRGGR